MAVPSLTWHDYGFHWFITIHSKQGIPQMIGVITWQLETLIYTYDISNINPGTMSYSMNTYCLPIHYLDAKFFISGPIPKLYSASVSKHYAGLIIIFSLLLIVNLVSVIHLDYSRQFKIISLERHCNSLSKKVLQAYV